MSDFIVIDEINGQVTNSESNIVSNLSSSESNIKQVINSSGNNIINNFEETYRVYQTESDSIGGVIGVITDFSNNTEANWTVPSSQTGAIGVYIKSQKVTLDTIEVYNNGILVYSEQLAIERYSQKHFMIIVQLQSGSVQLKTANSAFFFQYVSYTQLNNYESIQKNNSSITLTSDRPGTKIIVTDNDVYKIGQFNTTNLGTRAGLCYAVIPVLQGAQTFTFSNSSSGTVTANAVVLGAKKTLTSLKNIKNIQRGYLELTSNTYERVVHLSPSVSPQKSVVILSDNAYVKLFQTNSITLAAIQAPSAVTPVSYQLVEFW